MEKHPLHIKNPELQISLEVEQAVVRRGRKTGKKVPNDPAMRIEAYMDRLENVFLNPDVRVRQRNFEMFRDQIYDALIVKRENFPESYFELQKRVAREQGRGNIVITSENREQMMDVSIEDQKHSLDAWIDYLTSPDAVYPPWFKYFVWKNVTKLSQFDKERGEFKKRNDSTVAPFPDIYREPLAQIADIYEKVKEDNKNLKESEVREAFGKKFPALYAEFISESLAASMENREEIRGTWIKYEKGRTKDAEKLFESLEGKGTGWCTAGRSTAQVQIDRGDFYVYYTNDSSGEPTQPRLAIRMDGEKKIGEVRGVLSHQGVEPIMQEVLDGKLQEFGSEASAYRKKSEDMRILTVLEKKHQKGELFTKDELVFLYEMNGTIEGFGYERDPRIALLRKGRNSELDCLTIFECTKEEIAHTPSQIDENTKAYVGQLEAGIFWKLPKNIEYVYTSFPGKKIRRENVEIGGKAVEQLIRELEQSGVVIESIAKNILDSRDFVPGEHREKVTLVGLSVADLGFRGTTKPSLDRIYQQARFFGLERCSHDTALNYRLKYQNQPLGEWVSIAMEPIRVAGFVPGRVQNEILGLGHAANGLRLGTPSPLDGMYPLDTQFVFRLRESEF